jgi:transposase
MLGTSLRLSQPEYKELQARVRSRVLRAGDGRRARLILMLAEGQSWSAIQHALGCSSAYIARWQARFTQRRLAGLFARHRGRPVSKRTPRLEARILAWTRPAPDDGSTHWSSRKLARALGINHMMVARVWRRAGLKPHRLERHMASDDPDFERKAADVIERVSQFLADHPKLHLPFTPTYSSWLNQLELWFGRIEREVVARGVFTSVNDLARKLMRYIRHHNQHAAPIKRAYRDFSHRIIATSDSAVTGH